MTNPPKLTNPCTFYLVRHGQTEWNQQKRMQGHLDSPLTAKGIKQAEATKQQLADITFDHVYSSDLFRAQRTAEIIAADHQITVKTNQLLRECRLGPYAGKKLDTFLSELKKALDERETLSSQKQMTYQVHKDIETYEQLATRMLRFFKEVALAYPGNQILVVSHANIIRSTLVKLGFATNQELPHGSIPNTSLVTLQSDGIEFVIKDTHNINRKPH